MSDVKVSFPKLNGANWGTWKVRIESLLDRDDLWDVVVDPVPAEDKRGDEWKKNNRHAKSSILLFLEDNQFPIVKGQTTAHGVFEALKKHHEKNTRSVRVSLLKKLCSLNLSERGDVEQHLLKLDELFDRLVAAGMSLGEDTKICMLFRSLPESYDTLVTALDCMSDLDISVDLVRSKVLDENQRRLEREGGSVSRGEKAMRSAESGKGRGSRLCHYCKKPGHLVANCWKKQKDEEEDEREPKKEKGSAKAVQSDRRGVAFVVNGASSGAWIIDSGASAHMCHDKAFFTSLEEFAGGHISLADGDQTQIRGEGEGVLFGIDGDEKVQRIDVSGVKYVPGLATNLISVECLARKKLTVHFDAKGCRIIDPKNDVVATGVRHDGLYQLRLAESSLQASGGHHLENCKHQRHRRSGHRDWAAIERIDKKWKKKPSKFDETIPLRTFKEEEFEDEFTDAEVDTALKEESGRLGRRTKTPKHLENFVVGIAMCVAEEPESFHDALEEPEWCAAGCSGAEEAEKIDASLDKELSGLQHFLEAEVKRMEGVYKIRATQLVERLVVDLNLE